MINFDFCLIIKSLIYTLIKRYGAKRTQSKRASLKNWGS